VNVITTEPDDKQTETWASDVNLAEHHNISDDQLLEIHRKVSEGDAQSYDEDDDHGESLERPADIFFF
jgi:hypothetical protein